MKGYIYSPQSSLWGEREVIGFGTDEIHVKEIDRDLGNGVIIENHYSKKACNHATTQIHLGVFWNDELIGVLQLGYAMNPRSCGSIVQGTEIDQYLELNRMWIDDKAPRNIESISVSYSIKFIKRKYPKIKWIQSFADERCGGFGIVYQACNFGYYGEHTGIFWEYNGEVMHNSVITNNNRSRKKKLENEGFHDRAKKLTLRQFRYIFFIDKRWKGKCLLAEKPYPKHYNQAAN